MPTGSRPTTPTRDGVPHVVRWCTGTLRRVIRASRRLLPPACGLVGWAVWLLPGSAQAAPAAETPPPTLILVVGAAGEPEFGSNFVQQVTAWKQIAAQASAACEIIGDAPMDSFMDHQALEKRLQSEPRDGSQALWLVLIGHGTFDGEAARFNLRGPDVSSAELAGWLKPFTRPLVVINTASASAPFLSDLSGTNRVIVTATRSGEEQSFTHFGGYLADAITDPEGDLDRDDQVSLLEAFLVASSNVEEFYKTDGRLATEHALLDDNGDRKGTPADWFRGVRVMASPTGTAHVDGTRAAQMHLLLSPAEQALAPEIRARRNALELSLEQLRDQKADLDETEYYRQLEGLLLKLARLYRSSVPASSRPDGQ